MSTSVCTSVVHDLSCCLHLEITLRLSFSHLYSGFVQFAWQDTPTELSVVEKVRSLDAVRDRSRHERTHLGQRSLDHRDNHDS